MTTLIALFLTVSLLTGCSAAPAADLKNAAVSPPSLSATMSMPAPPRYTVATRTLSDVITAGDGTELVRYAIDVPELTVRRADGSRVERPENPAEEAAVEKAEVFNSRFEDWVEDGGVGELSAAAGNDLAMRLEDGTPWPGAYEVEFTYEAYQTDRLLSISGTYESYTGGAHGNICLLSWNFDLDSGSFVLPEHLAADSRTFLESVQAEIVRQCRAAAAEKGVEPDVAFWANYEDIAADWSGYAVSFDEEGMSVAFSPYELACYAAGPQIFTLSYGELAPLLSEHGREVLGLSEE